MPTAKRRPRLSWFRFYADDFLGGTGALTAPECGQYLLLLLYQWGTKNQQVIPDDAERLRVICRGEDPSKEVIEKFVRTAAGFRNQRLAEEWESARLEYEHKSRGHIPTQTVRQILPHIPPQILPATKNQEPRTITEDGRTPSVAPANPLVAGRRPEMERDGYRLIREINALEPERDPLDILMEAAGWETKDGKFRTKCRLETMTDDHLIRTIRDLKTNLAEARENGKQAAQRRP